MLVSVNSYIDMVMLCLCAHREGVYPLEICFTSSEKRAIWEATLLDAKQKLCKCTEQYGLKVDRYQSTVKLRDYTHGKLELHAYLKVIICCLCIQNSFHIHVVLIQIFLIQVILR